MSKYYSIIFPFGNIKIGCRFTNIEFDSWEERYDFLKDVQADWGFTEDVADPTNGVKFMLQEGWFKDQKEADFILNTLKNRKDIVIVAKGDEDYDIVSKEDYQEYYEKNIKSRETEEEWSEEAKEIRDHLLNTVKNNKTKKWYEIWKN